MTEAQLTTVRKRILKIIVGLNLKDSLVVLMSLASVTAAILMKMPRRDFMEMCGEFYDRRANDESPSTLTIDERRRLATEADRNIIQ